ncbi:MAG: Na+/H+ antiporter [Proteobacteria bacterium]|nr:Na+/H+ antiporter [Pseudomonadota bacterium]
MSAVALILLLIAASAALRYLSDRIGVPLPTLLVLGGLGLALIPGLPRLNLDPETVFLVFIPPLLFWTALQTSLRDLIRNRRSITLLALWLVLITLVTVAAVTHTLLPALPWAVCFLLGAIVSPPDAVAVTASSRSLSLPRTALVLLEGESLMNDATALVAYQIALAAAVTGTFSLPRAAGELVLTGAGGIGIGLALGFAVGWVRQRMARTSLVENTLSLLSPFIAYIPADALGGSGVLAVVAMGLYLARYSPRVITAPTRLQGAAMWEMLAFVLEGLIFIFIGLELPVVVAGLAPGSALHLVKVSLLVVAAMTATRIAWMFIGAYLPRWLDRRLARPTTPYPPWRNVLFLGWAGIRGGDSLVIALALPYTGLHSAPLPGRAEIVFITFVVIFITLVVQGLTLSPMIRLLGIVSGNEEQGEERAARSASIRAGAAALAQLNGLSDGELQVADALKRAAHYRLKRAEGTDSSPAEYARLRLAMLAAERNTVIGMRDRGEISDAVLLRLQREFDHEEMLLRHDE